MGCGSSAQKGVVEPTSKNEKNGKISKEKVENDKDTPVTSLEVKQTKNPIPNELESASMASQSKVSAPTTPSSISPHTTQTQNTESVTQVEEIVQDEQEKVQRKREPSNFVKDKPLPSGLNNGINPTNAVTDMNGEPLSHLQKLPSITLPNAERRPIHVPPLQRGERTAADKKTNPVSPPREAVAFEVNISKKRTRKSALQERLENGGGQSRNEMTADEIKAKQAAAEERRKKEQGKRVKKAVETSVLVEERKQKLKELEDKKTEQLKLIIMEKKKLAEQKRIAQENESKKKLEDEAKHAQDVINKAKLRKQLEDQDKEKDKENESSSIRNTQMNLHSPATSISGNHGSDIENSVPPTPTFSNNNLLSAGPTFGNPNNISISNSNSSLSLASKSQDKEASQLSSRSISSNGSLSAKDRSRQPNSSTSQLSS